MSSTSQMESNAPRRKTTVTSPVTSNTPPPVQAYATTHTGRRAPPLSNPWLHCFRILCLSKLIFFLLKRSIKKTCCPCRRSKFLFHEAWSHYFSIALPSRPLFVAGSGIIIGPSVSERRLTQKMATDRTRLACQRRQKFWKVSCICLGHDPPYDGEEP